MKLTIFAATGGIGRHIVDQALAAAHQVTVVVRDPAKLPPEARAVVRTVTADLAEADPEALEAAVDGADAVLSGLGPRSSADAGVTSRGTRAIVAAMQATGVRRLIVVSAAPLGTVPSPGNPNPPRHDPGDGFFMRHLFSRIAGTLFREHYADLAVMEDLVRNSGLDWTIVRPPRLTNKPMSGAYRTAYGQNLRGGFLVSRADVAHLMLRVLAQPESIKHTVGIAN
jgi:putative NADH-flavin reductase